MKEKNAKTRKELTDYVEETFGCIVCMVRIYIVTIEVIYIVSMPSPSSGHRVHAGHHSLLTQHLLVLLEAQL